MFQTGPFADVQRNSISYLFQYFLSSFFQDEKTGIYLDDLKDDDAEMLQVIDLKIDTFIHYRIDNYVIASSVVQRVFEIRTSPDYGQLVCIQYTTHPDFRQCLKS